MNATQEKILLFRIRAGLAWLALALFLLAALIALASGLVGPSGASAKTPSAPQNRVWENSARMLQLHPIQTPQSLELQREKSIGRYDSAVADTLAAESTASIPASESWANPSTLADHFARHGADFGATSAEDYASQASQFLQRAQQEGLPTKIDSNGIIRVYDPETNTFGSYNPNGTTRTFYKPPAGINYWSRQPGVAPTIVGGQ